MGELIMDAATSNTRRGRTSKLVGFTSLLCAFLLMVTGVAPASAASVALSGYQTENTNVYWGTGRLNLHSSNRMSFYYASLTNSYVATMAAGARTMVGSGSSFAKSPEMNKGQTKSLVMQNGTGYAIPSGTFYTTTYLGWYGCPICSAQMWTGSVAEYSSLAVGCGRCPSCPSDSSSAAIARVNIATPNHLGGAFEVVLGFPLVVEREVEDVDMNLRSVDGFGEAKVSPVPRRIYSVE